MLSVSNLYGGYKQKMIIQDINFEMEHSQKLFILGSNGSGKTTLIKMITGLLAYNKGSIVCDGIMINDSIRASKLMAYIPQTFEQPFDYTVFDMVMMARIGNVGMFSRTSKEDIQKVYQALDALELTDLRYQVFNQLSGGQKKMVMIARSICKGCRMIVMDEPFSNLDYKNQRLIEYTIDDLYAKGYRLIISTHSIQRIDVQSKVLLLKQGNQLCFGNACDIMTDNIMSELYNTHIKLEKVTANNKIKYMTF